MTPSLLLFWILAIVSVGASLAMITTKNAVRSALALVATFLCVAVFYITLSAQFIAMVQIIVYAGAIMVLFLFVIMLLNLGAPTALDETRGLQIQIAPFLGAVFFALLWGAHALVQLPTEGAAASVYEPLGTVEGVGLHLYDPNLPWLFPFEATSILLLVAVIGAIIMAKRRI